MIFFKSKWRFFSDEILKTMSSVNFVDSLCTRHFKEPVRILLYAAMLVVFVFADYFICLSICWELWCAPVIQLLWRLKRGDILGGLFHLRFPVALIYLSGRLDGPLRPRWRWSGTVGPSVSVVFVLHRSMILAYRVTPWEMTPFLNNLLSVSRCYMSGCRLFVYIVFVFSTHVYMSLEN